MTREEAMQSRRDALVDHMENNEDVAQWFGNASEEEADKFVEEYYAELSKKNPQLGQYKIDEKSHTSYYEMWPGGTGEPVTTTKDVNVPLHDPKLEYLYDAVTSKGEDGNTLVSLGDIGQDGLIAVGAMLHERKHPMSAAVQYWARKEYEDYTGYEKPTAIESIERGIAKPLEDVVAFTAEKLGADMEFYNKSNMLESLAYPDSKRLEGVGELIGMIGGASAAYKGLQKVGLNRVIKGGKLSPAGLAATGAAEFGLGYSYATPTLILNPEDPNRVLSGVEAMMLGTALNLAVDTVFPFKGKTVQEVTSRLDDINPEGWKDAREVISAKQSQMPQQAVDAPPQPQQAADTKLTPEFVNQVNAEIKVDRLATRRGELLKQKNANPREQIRVTQRLNDARIALVQAQEEYQALSKTEKVAEDAAPGSILGVTPYGAMTKEEAKLGIAKELTKRTAMGGASAWADPLETEDPLKNFMIGFALPTFSTKGLSLKPFDYVIKPLDQSVKDISPLVWNKQQGMIMKSMENATKRFDTAQPFFDKLDSLVRSKGTKTTVQDLQELTTHMYNGHSGARNSWFARHDPSGELQKHWKQVSKVLDDAIIEAQDAGLDIKNLDNYFPRMMKDFEEFQKIRGYTDPDLFSKAINKFKQDVGRLPTEAERMEIFSEVIRNQPKSSPFYTKSRKVDEVFVEDLPAYHNMRDSFANYIGDITHRTEMRRFLGQSGKDIPTNKYGALLKDSVGNSIEEWVDGLTQKGIVVEAKKAQKLKDMLSDWSVNSRRSGGDWMSAYKNLFYSATIGNPFSTLTQLNDLAIMATKDPLAAGSAFAEAIGNKALKFGWRQFDDATVASDIITTGSGWKELGKSAKDLSKKPTSAQRWGDFSQKLLNTSLKWSGFKKVDQAMKGLGADIHYKRLQKWASAPKDSTLYKKLERKLKPAWGDAFDELVDDLKRGDMDSGNVKLAVFNEVTQIHPVDPAHMPHFYNKNPNLRWTYALKSFMARHINFMRTELIGDIRKAKTAGEFKDAMQTYGTYVALFSGANMGISAFKDFVLGREVTLSDRMLESMTSTLAGVSRFQIYQGKDIFSSKNAYQSAGELGRFIIGLAPVNPLLDVASDINKAAAGEVQGIEDVSSVKYAPLAGKWTYWRLGAGKAKEQKRKAKRSKPYVPPPSGSPWGDVSNIPINY